MKKLIIAAFAVAFATVAQAATVKWTAGKVYEMGTETKAGASYIAYFISSADYAYADALADLTNGSASFVSTYGQAAKALSSGAASQTITTTAGNSESWSGYLVILDSTAVDTATYAYLTTETSKSTGSTGQSANLSWLDLSDTQNSSTWAAVNVPEPTSALMLLVGLAGLALKRKVA